MMDEAEARRRRIRNIVERHTDMGTCSVCGFTPYRGNQHPYAGRWLKGKGNTKMCYGTGKDQRKWREHLRKSAQERQQDDDIASFHLEPDDADV